MKSDLFHHSALPFHDHDANVFSRLFPSIATQVLFLFEIVFTLLKGSLLLNSCPGKNCRRVIFLFFALESLAGISLSVLFAREVLSYWQTKKNTTVVAALVLVLFTELFTILTEAMVIRARIGNRKITETRAGKAIQALLRVSGFICSTGIVCFALYVEVAQGNISNRTTSQSRTVIGILSAAVAVNVIILVLSAVIPSYLKTRANMSILCVATASIFSIVSALNDLFEGRPRGRVGFDFPLHVILAIFFLASGTLSSAISAWFMPVMQSEIEAAHVAVLETAALSVIGPAVIIGMSSIFTVNALHVLLTILPQSGALVAPLVLSYLITRFRKPIQKHEEKD